MVHLDETNVSCVCVHVCAVLMCGWVHVCVGWAFIIVFTVSSPQEESRMSPDLGEGTQSTSAVRSSSVVV